VTRAEAITAEVHRVAAAAAHGQTHLAHIRVAALRRLRGAAPYDYAHLTDDADGDAMFGDDHLHPTIDLPLAA
jgi:hypothetical protein